MKKLSLAEKLKMLSDELAEMSYELTFGFPKYEQYALGDQIRRSLLSVPSNIYEGLCQDGDTNN